MSEEENIIDINIFRDQIPEGKIRFETKVKLHPNGSVEKEIWIGDQILDWSIDVTSFHEAVRMGPMYKKAVQRDIVNHFVSCVSDLVGRNVTIQEINEAIKVGYI